MIATRNLKRSFLKNSSKNKKHIKKTTNQPRSKKETPSKKYSFSLKKDFKQLPDKKPFYPDTTLFCKKNSFSDRPV